MRAAQHGRKNRAGLCLVFDQVVFCKVGRSVFDVLYNLFQMLEIAFRIERVSGGLGGSEVRFVGGGGHGQHSFPKYRIEEYS